jgi:hypothetical protein
MTIEDAGIDNLWLPEHFLVIAKDVLFLQGDP